MCGSCAKHRTRCGRVGRDLLLPAFACFGRLVCSGSFLSRRWRPSFGWNPRNKAHRNPMAIRCRCLIQIRTPSLQQRRPASSSSAAAGPLLQPVFSRRCSNLMTVACADRNGGIETHGSRRCTGSDLRQRSPMRSRYIRQLRNLHPRPFRRGVETVLPAAAKAITLVSPGDSNACCPMYRAGPNLFLHWQRASKPSAKGRP